MEPVCYTVQTINGDYAYLLSDSGVENQVAMFQIGRASCRERV